MKIIIQIEKLVYEGFGIGRYNGIVVFVENVCSLDILEVEIYKVKKCCVFARIIKIIEKSPYRVKQKCNIAKICGSCQWQQVSYKQQLIEKENIVKELIKGKLGYEVEIRPIIASKKIFEYRHKIQLPISQTKKSKKYLIGYYKTNTHDIVNTKFCHLNPPLVNDLTEQIRNLIQSFKIPAYNEKNHKGILKHLVFKLSQDLSQVLVILVINSKSLDNNIVSLAEKIYQLNNVIGVNINFNYKKNNIILSNESTTILGQDFYIETIDSFKYKIGPESFFQVNPYGAKNILRTAKKMITQYSSHKTDLTVLDAYCGVGTFGIYLNQIAKKIFFVEQTKNSIKNCIENIKMNNIDNAEVFSGDVKMYLQQFLNKKYKFDVVIIDPPRKGCNSDVINFVSKLCKNIIIYVSCNPNTLVRDLKIFKNFNFKAKIIQPIDMFCHSYHIENVTLLYKETL